MVSIYDIVWQKCNFKSAGIHHLDKFIMEQIFEETKPTKDESWTDDFANIFVGSVFLDIASKYLCLKRGEVDLAYDYIFPVNDGSKYYQIAVDKEKDIELSDFCQIYLKYCDYGEVAHDTVHEWLPRNTSKKGFSHYEYLILEYASLLEKFEAVEGATLGPKCRFDGAYNNIISCSYTEDLLHIMNDTLWVITTSHFEKRNVITLLIAYVMGMKNDKEKYRKIKRFGVFSITRGTIHTVPVEKFTQSTFKNIAKSYVGYKDEGQENWEDFEGTDANLFREVANYHKDLLPPEVFKKYYVQSENIVKQEFKRLPYIIETKEGSDTALTVIAHSMKNMPAFTSGKRYGIQDFAIYYISDIHLEHHVTGEAQKNKRNLMKEIEDIAKGLVTKTLARKLFEKRNDIIIMFLGDTSNSIELSRIFYESFMAEIRRHTTDPKVYAVIGNHELSEFDTLKGGIREYKKLFKSVGITMLHNEYEVIRVGCFAANNIAVAGGVGFAKYNDKFNSDTQVGAADMTHKKDSKESDALNQIHTKVLNDPSAYGRIILFLSHYPLKDWMREEDISSRCMYFNGHNHQNTSVTTQNRSIYSDGQIGYKKKKIAFKKLTVGPYYNPFVDLEDGVYEIGIESYHQFYEYNSERLNGTYFIDQQLKKGGKLCMIKQYEYYGFFIVKDDGIMICKGGRVAGLPYNNGFQYYADNFAQMVSGYINLLLPFRKAEEMLSENLKAIGLSGRIHGCIIDLDFTNHIMINPVDGKVTVYNSPVFGIVKEYDNLGTILEEMAQKDPRLYSKSLEKYKKKELKLPRVVKNMSGEYERVETDSESTYGISRDIRNVERLFTNNILRDWEDRLLYRESREGISTSKKVRKR